MLLSMSLLSMYLGVCFCSWLSNVWLTRTMILVCSVYVTQAFDAVKEDKKVKLPQLPTETIKLLPVEGIQGPEEPPVKTTLRACLLIDCTSPQKPQFVGVHTTSGTTMKDVKRSVAEIIGKKLDDKTSVSAL